MEIRRYLLTSLGSARSYLAEIRQNPAASLRNGDTSLGYNLQQIARNETVKNMTDISIGVGASIAMVANGNIIQFIAGLVATFDGPVGVVYLQNHPVIHHKLKTTGSRIVNAAKSITSNLGSAYKDAKEKHLPHTADELSMASLGNLPTHYTAKPGSAKSALQAAIMTQEVPSDSSESGSPTMLPISPELQPHIDLLVKGTPKQKQEEFGQRVVMIGDSIKLP